MAFTCTVSSQLLNAFETGDERRTTWIGGYKSGANTWYYPYKYQNSQTKSVNSGEYTMVLRLAEQYLIRAEARAEKNDLVNAISDINAIRTRAGLSILSTSLSQSQVLSAVAHERQVELFTEGQRWFDLKRTNAVDATMQAVTPLKAGAPWNTIQQLYPLSVPDLQAGINLVQNAGY